MIEGLLALIIICVISIALAYIVWMPIFIAAEWIGDLIGWLRRPRAAIEPNRSLAE